MQRQIKTTTLRSFRQTHYPTSSQSTSIHELVIKYNSTHFIIFGFCTLTAVCSDKKEHRKNTTYFSPTYLSHQL